ncbi:MAG: hypothetical protein SF182_01150 [Deltaproteobacteria bacterium]|nr:hypothetical protein [Deltaproteobacteria bacterium]
MLARHRWTLAATLLVALGYVASLAVMPKHVFWMPDEGAKLFELAAVGLSWRDGVTYRIPFAGQRLLPGNEFLPGFDVFPEPSTAPNGQLYLNFDNPVIFPLLSKPLFHLLGPLGLYVVPLCCGCLVALLSGVLASWFVPRLAPAAVLLVGFATPVWFYSVVFWEHTLATLFALLAVCALVRAPLRLEAIAVALPALLFASMLRAEMPALGAALGLAWVAVLVNARRAPGGAAGGSGAPRWLGGWRLAALSLAASAGLGVFLWFSLTARHRSLLRVVPERLAQALGGLEHVPRGLVEVFVNSQTLGPPVSPAWRAAAVAALVLPMVAALLGSAPRRALLACSALVLMLACSAALVVTGEPYRGLHGLFPVAPFLILWPLALRGAWRRHDARRLMLGIAALANLALCFGALAITYMHQGVLDVGMQWGQRYLLTAYPMLTVLALIGLRALWAAQPAAWTRTALVSLFTLLAVAGVGLEARGLRMLYGTRSVMAKWDAAMRAEGPVVTTVWWIVPAVADLYLSHDMYFTWKTGMAHWVERARQQGISSFTLAHTEPLGDAQLDAPGLTRLPDGARTITGGLLLTRFRIDPLSPP